MRNPESILITGASSGIGEAIALEYAKPGRYLALGGRDLGRLDIVANACRKKGASVSATAIDVKNQKAMDKWIKDVDALHMLDLIIANAGISGDSGKSSTCLNELITRDIFATNAIGVLNTIFPVLQNMRKRKRGHIVFLSSAAGFRGLSSAPAYSSTKVMIKAYGEALHGILCKENIGVTVVCPGFVKSRLTDKNSFPMPFIINASIAAQKIRRGIEKNKLLVAFPWPIVILTFLINILPLKFLNKILSQTPNK